MAAPQRRWPGSKPRPCMSCHRVPAPQPCLRKPVHVTSAAAGSAVVHALNPARACHVTACLHRSLACKGRCMSLFRRFESAVCQPSNPPRQLAAPLARLQTPPVHVTSPHACTAAPLARLQTPPVHVMSPRACTAALPAKAGARHSLGVSKAPFASLQTLRGSWQQPCWRKPARVPL